MYLLVLFGTQCTYAHAFLQFARKFSRGEPITIEYLVQSLQWPLPPPKVISDMTHLEAVFDIFDAYKWLR